MELDSLNQHILALLQQNARQSATDIGRTAVLVENSGSGPN